LPRATQRLDRKALKHDGLVDFAARATEYVNVNANQVLGIAAGVVVVIVLVVFWGRGHAHKMKESDVRFSQVVAAFSNGSYDGAVQLAGTLQTEFGGSTGALQASYIAGQALLHLGKFPEAEQAFRNYLASASKAPFYEQAAKGGLGAALEGQHRYADAAAIYQEAIAKLSEPLASEARLDAARALRLAGSADQAKSLLEAVPADNYTLSNQAKQELAVLDGVRGATPPTAPPAPAAAAVSPGTPPAPEPAKNP
jgi:tetratricopeptide (TPR) repeat protein